MNIPLIGQRPDLLPPQARKQENLAANQQYAGPAYCGECHRQFNSRRGAVKHREKTGHEISS